MITIKYKKYWNDLRNSYETKTFYSLSEYKRWLLDILDGSTDKFSYYVPTKEPARIEVRSRDHWHYFTYMIIKDGAIIFSDGHFTNGIKHWNDEAKSFLAGLKHEIENPQYNFG